MIHEILVGIQYYQRNRLGWHFKGLRFEHWKFIL